MKHTRKLWAVLLSILMVLQVAVPALAAQTPQELFTLAFDGRWVQFMDDGTTSEPLPQGISYVPAERTVVLTDARLESLRLQHGDVCTLRLEGQNTLTSSTAAPLTLEDYAQISVKGPGSLIITATNGPDKKTSDGKVYYNPGVSLGTEAMLDNSSQVEVHMEGDCYRTEADGSVTQVMTTAVEGPFDQGTLLHSLGGSFKAVGGRLAQGVANVVAETGTLEGDGILVSKWLMGTGGHLIFHGDVQMNPGTYTSFNGGTVTVEGSLLVSGRLEIGGEVPVTVTSARDNTAALFLNQGGELEISGGVTTLNGNTALELDRNSTFTMTDGVVNANGQYAGMRVSNDTYLKGGQLNATAALKTVPQGQEHATTFGASVEPARTEPAPDGSEICFPGGHLEISGGRHRFTTALDAGAEVCGTGLHVSHEVILSGGQVVAEGSREAFYGETFGPVGQPYAWEALSLQRGVQAENNANSQVIEPVFLKETYNNGKDTVKRTVFEADGQSVKSLTFKGGDPIMADHDSFGVNGQWLDFWKDGTVTHWNGTEAEAVTLPKGMRYDYQRKELSLNSVTLDSLDLGYRWYNPKDNTFGTNLVSDSMTICLSGHNVIKNGADNPLAIHDELHVTIFGGGTLEATAINGPDKKDSENRVYANPAIALWNGATLTNSSSNLIVKSQGEYWYTDESGQPMQGVPAGMQGGFRGGTAYIQNGGTLTCPDGWAVQGFGEVHLNGGTLGTVGLYLDPGCKLYQNGGTLTVHPGRSAHQSSELDAADGELTVSGGNLVVEKGGLIVRNLQIGPEAKVQVTNPGGAALNLAENGYANLRGNVTLQGSTGLRLQPGSNLDLDGGTLTAEGQWFGVENEGLLCLQGGNLLASCTAAAPMVDRDHAAAVEVRPGGELLVFSGDHSFLAPIDTAMDGPGGLPFQAGGLLAYGDVTVKDGTVHATGSRSAIHGEKFYDLGGEEPRRALVLENHMQAFSAQGDKPLVQLLDKSKAQDGRGVLACWFEEDNNPDTPPAFCHDLTIRRGEPQPEESASFGVNGQWLTLYPDGRTGVWDDQGNFTPVALPQGVTYDYASNTITLNNANLTSLHGSYSWKNGNDSGINLPSNTLTIELVGETSIRSTKQDPMHFFDGLFVHVQSTDGTGHLTVTAVNSDQIFEPGTQKNYWIKPVDLYNGTEFYVDSGHVTLNEEGEAWGWDEQSGQNVPSVPEGVYGSYDGTTGFFVTGGTVDGNIRKLFGGLQNVEITGGTVTGHGFNLGASETMQPYFHLVDGDVTFVRASADQEMELHMAETATMELDGGSFTWEDGTFYVGGTLNIRGTAAVTGSTQAPNDYSAPLYIVENREVNVDGGSLTLTGSTGLEVGIGGRLNLRSGVINATGQWFGVSDQGVITLDGGSLNAGALRTAAIYGEPDAEGNRPILNGRVCGMMLWPSAEDRAGGVLNINGGSHSFTAPVQVDEDNLFAIGLCSVHETNLNGGQVHCEGYFDAVYGEAFGPVDQPAPWTPLIFRNGMTAFSDLSGIPLELLYWEHPFENNPAELLRVWEFREDNFLEGYGEQGKVVRSLTIRPVEAQPAVASFEVNGRDLSFDAQGKAGWYDENGFHPTVVNGLTYDPDTNTLTLDNAHLESLDLDYLWKEENGTEHHDLPTPDMTLVLRGSNTLESGNRPPLSVGGKLHLTVQGDGQLTAITHNDKNKVDDRGRNYTDPCIGLRDGAALTVESTVTMEQIGESWYYNEQQDQNVQGVPVGVLADTGCAVTLNSGSLNMKNGWVLQNVKTVTVSGGKLEGVGLFMEQGSSFTQTAGDVLLHGADRPDQEPRFTLKDGSFTGGTVTLENGSIEVSGQVTVGGEAVIKAHCGEDWDLYGTGLLVNSGSLTVFGGKLELSGPTALSIGEGTSLQLTGGTILASGQWCGVWLSGTASLSGGSLRGSASEKTFRMDGDNVAWREADGLVVASKADDAGRLTACGTLEITGGDHSFLAPPDADPIALPNGGHYLSTGLLSYGVARITGGTVRVQGGYEAMTGGAYAPSNEPYPIEPLQLGGGIAAISEATGGVVLMEAQEQEEPGHKACYWVFEENGQPVKTLILRQPSAVSGQVTVDGKPAAGVTVTLGRDFKTVTDAQGSYSFTQVPYGSYNLMAKTTDGDSTTDVFTMTAATTEFPLIAIKTQAGSAVEIAPEAPDLIVDGLQDEADAWVTETTKKVKVEMTVTPVQQNQQIEEAAKPETGDTLTMVEIKLEKTVTEGSSSPNTSELTETKKLVTVKVPVADAENYDFRVYRVHDGKLQSLTEGQPTVEGQEYYVVDRATGEVVLHVKNFSTYGIHQISRGFGSAALTETGVTVTLEPNVEAGSLYAAAYDQEGRMVSATTAEVKAGSKTAALPLELQGAKTVRVFYQNSTGVPYASKTLDIR